MRAVWLEVPEGFLERRHALGHDKHDEVWDGELHMAPPPTSKHGRRSLDLAFGLKPIADRRGLVIWPDQTGVFGPLGSNTNYRIPDVSVSKPDQVSERGLESAELVIEMLSQYDESRAKFPFYAHAGVREIWLIEPKTRVHEVHALVGDGYQRISPAGGPTRSSVLDIEISIVDGPKLRLRDGDYVVDV